MIDWTEFCDWLRTDMDLSDLPIEWSRISNKDQTIIRFDICRDRPYHVTTAINDRQELYTHEVAHELARGLLPVLTKAIATNSPYTYITYFPLEYVP